MCKTYLNTLLCIQHCLKYFELHATRGASERLKKYNAKVIFLLGQGEEGQAAVMEESRLHSDIVQEDFKVGETGLEASIGKALAGTDDVQACPFHSRIHTATSL